jgi:hypothetical protein
MSFPRRPQLTKYSNVKIDGYDSKREAIRANELRLLQRRGEISNLREQVKFELIPKQIGMRAITYTADFAYFDKAGVEHIEDVKGIETEVFKIKRKLLMFMKGIAIEVVK